MHEERRELGEDGMRVVLPMQRELIVGGLVSMSTILPPLVRDQRVGR